MKIHSPISLLMETIEHVRTSSRIHSAKLRNNEAITRAVLIDPIVQVLGWDTRNPEMVEFEKYYKNTKLDYALNDCRGEVNVILEAKAFGANLMEDKIVNTILSYGITYRVPNIILTDGIIWKHYKIENFSNLTPAIINLETDPIHLAARYLIDNLDATLFWNEAINVTATNNPVVAEPPQLIVNGKAIEQGDGYINLSDLPLSLTGKKAPRSLRLPNGEIKTISNWRDILVECVRFLLAHTPDINFPLLDKAGKKCILIDYYRMPQKGSIIQEHYRGREVYVYLNYDSNHIVANSQFVLDMAPEKVKAMPCGVLF